jgi:hypothetical protein
MKTQGNVILVLFISIFILSCSKEPSKQIIGEWKVADIAYSEKIDPDLKEMLDETIKETKESSSWTLNENGTFVKIIAEQSSNGKWVLSEDAKNLTLTYEDGSQEVSKVIELSDTKLIISYKINDIEYTNTYEKKQK